MKTLILFFLFLNFYLWAIANDKNKVVPLKDASVLHGKIFGSKKCEGPVVVWISKKTEILYQVEAPINGTFEFHLVPGEYDIAATSSNDCQIKKTFNVAKGESKTLEIHLKK